MFGQMKNFMKNQGCGHWAGQGAYSHPPLQFLNNTFSLLLFTGVQKLYRPEMSRFLICMLQFLDNLRQLFIF